MTRHNKKTFPFFLWHRRLGLITLLLVSILSITGIMLNHTEGLKLDSQTINNKWLLDWYGLNPTGKPTSFKAGNHIITQWDQQLFFNNNLIKTTNESMLGAIESNGIIIILTRNSILLLDESGALIELIQPTFKPFKRLGQLNSQASIETADNKIYIADQDIISWQPIHSNKISWVIESELNPDQKENIRISYRGSGLTLERIILDLHSGRIFNAHWGVYLMDASAVSLILLSMSGVWVWWSRKQKVKAKRQYRKHHH